ncbi:putative alpha-L-rhamnosidase B [Halenospora varia]|nr:putative alpha-L-rhamnosidase B [Halenospora varia]
MFSSRLLAFLLAIIHFVESGTAQSCWKDTTCSGPNSTAFPGPWESNIYAPSSRTVSPKSILSLQTGNVISAWPGPAKFQGNGTQLVFDFGIEVGGLVTVKYTTTAAGTLGLAFTEGKNWIGEWSDSSNGKFVGPDGYLAATFNASGNGTYTMPEKVLRGGFRYLTLFLMTTANATIDVTDISLNIGFQPTWSNLRAYQGYFHSNDEELNKIWYSGAYTLQTNSVPVNTGRWVPTLSKGWANNGTLGPGDTIIVDGAKRDRAVWPGDMGVAVPSTHVSIGDLDSVRNALQVMYNYQNPTTGAFPEAGPPLLQLGSDTYHMWTMIGSYNYVLYSNDTAWLQTNWAKYLKAMDFIYDKVGSTSGLLNVTGTRDWARWQTAGEGSQANMILYRTLITGADLAIWARDSTGLNSTWLRRAVDLRKAINSHCWDESYGAFKDNNTATTLHPQDANSMALLFGVVDTPAKAESASTNLLKNWTPIGAQTPELPNNVSPFISSFEIQGHLTIGQTARALELIKRCWGWYLNNPNGTQSTVIEGYLIDGSFGYRADRGYSHDTSYVSHAHGWSAGPTSALTTYILGLSVTSPAGKKWKLAPQFGDIKSVEGGFMTGLGKFQASWKLQSRGYTLSYNTPSGTTGQLELPCLETGRFPSISINKRPVPRSMNARIVGSSIVLDVDGGEHSIIVN